MKITQIFLVKSKVFCLSKICVLRFVFFGCCPNQFKSVVLVKRLKVHGLLSYHTHGKDTETKVVNNPVYK